MCASGHFRTGSAFAALIVYLVLDTELRIKPKPVTAAVTFTCTRKSFPVFPDYWFNPINLSGWLLGRLYRPAHAFCFHIRFHYIFYGLPYRPATGRKGAWRSTALAGRLYSWNKHIRNDECRLPTPPLHTWAGSVHELTSVREKWREPTPDACAANNRWIWMNFINNLHRDASINRISTCA